VLVRVGKRNENRIERCGVFAWNTISIATLAKPDGLFVINGRIYARAVAASRAAPGSISLPAFHALSVATAHRRHGLDVSDEVTA
jgi:hypothetical protein